MAQLGARRSSAPAASSRVALPDKCRAATSVKSRVAFLEEHLSGAASTAGSPCAPKSVFETRYTSTLTYKVRPLFTSAETQGRADSSGFAGNSELKANTYDFNKNRFSKPSWRNCESQKPIVSFSSSRHGTGLSLAHQTFRRTDGELGPLIYVNPANLLEAQKSEHVRLHVTAGGPRGESTEPPGPRTRLPGVLVLGRAPPKPDRPPRTHLRRFGGKKISSNGPGVKTPLRAAPAPTPPPLPLRTPLSHQMDKDKCNDVGITKPPSHLYEEHPPNRTEADLRGGMHEKVDRGMEQAKKSKKQKESDGGREDINHGEVTQEKEADSKGTIDSEQIKRQAMKEEKKQLTRQKTNEKKQQEAKTLLKIKGPAHVIKKALLDFKGGKSDSSLNQGGIVHSADDCVKSESDDTEEEEEEEEEEPEPGTMSDQYESEVYDDIVAPADGGLNVQNVGEDDVYDDVDNPETRVDNLPQPDTDGDDVYDDVDCQTSPLPFDGPDIYGDISEDCIYEID